jgi:hypothetical protein
MLSRKLLVRGGVVYDHDGDVHKPKTHDVLMEGGDIVAVGAGLTADDAEVIDARGKLIIPVSSMRTTIPTTRSAAACSRNCPWKCGCSTPYRWAPTAAATR